MVRFTSFAAPCTFLASALILPALAQTTEPLTYNTLYDNPSYPLNSVACSNGAHGLEPLGYTTIGSLPCFPNVGGVYTVKNWNSTFCGTCYKVTSNGTYTYILAIDTYYSGFDVSEEAMNELTGGRAVELGTIEVTSVEVDKSYCGL